MEEKCIDFRCNKNKNNRKTYKKRGFRGVEMGKTYRNPRFLSSFSWKLTKSMRILVDFWSKIRFLGQKVEFFGGSVWKSMEKPGISSKYSVFLWKNVKKWSFSEKMAIFFQKTPFRGPNIGQGLCGPPHPSFPLSLPPFSWYTLGDFAIASISQSRRPVPFCFKVVCSLGKGAPPRVWISRQMWECMESCLNQFSLHSRSLDFRLFIAADKIHENDVKDGKIDEKLAGQKQADLVVKNCKI